MSALDKLNAKAIKKVNAEVKKETDSAEFSFPKSEVKKEVPEADLKASGSFAEKPKKPEAVKEPKKKKHPGGRKPTRGQNGKDYKMMNIAIPMEIYEKLQAASNGNMTYYINSILKSSVDD